MTLDHANLPSRLTPTKAFRSLSSHRLSFRRLVMHNNQKWFLHLSYIFWCVYHKDDEKTTIMTKTKRRFLVISSQKWSSENDNQQKMISDLHFPSFLLLVFKCKRWDRRFVLQYLASPRAYAQPLLFLNAVTRWLHPKQQRQHQNKTQLYNNQAL